MKNNSTEEVIKDFEYKKHTLYDNVLTINLADDDLYEDISRIKKLVKLIIKSEGDLIFIKENENGIKHLDCKSISVFTELKYCAKRTITSELAIRFPVHSLNPYLALFIKNMTKELGVGIDLDRNCSGEVLEKVVDKLNKFINSIRSEAKNQKFKKNKGNYQRPLNKNYNSLIGYINKLFDKNDRILVIRIDFHYRKDVDIRYLTEIERNEMYGKAKEDLEHFLNNKRSKNKIFEHMVGYAWKLEFAPLTGFHYHLFFFFNGSKVQQDIDRAEMIGEYWQNTITEGRGRYFNYNKKKDEYKLLGVGMIHRDDAKLREGLKKAAEYVTKTGDNNARMIPLEKNGRTFDRGKISKMGPEVQW